MKKFITVTIPIIFLVIASFYITAQFIQPAPKKEITIASGSKNGCYHKIALKYKELLEKDNVKVTIVNSAGSMDNIELLKNKKADIAFIQNGTINKKEQNIKSLASIYYEPLWIFYKNEGFVVDYIIQFTGKKIAVGGEGSGTKDLSEKILKDNGIDSSNSQILSLSSKQAKEKLINGEIDVMFAVTSHYSEMVKQLLQNPKVRVLSIKRAKAYGRKYPFLEDLTIYEGTLNLYQNLPDEDVNLLGTTATLIVREGFSEELIRLLLKRIKEVHNKKTLFAKAEQFPNDLNMTLEVHEEASRYFKYGDTWLEKIFPYWIASNIDRLKILLIPLLTLLFPLFKGAFPLYNWTMRSKIYRWYEEVKQLDKKLENLDEETLKEYFQKLEDLKIEIKKETSVPLSYMGEYYNLQLHIDLLEKEILRKLGK